MRKFTLKTLLLLAIMLTGGGNYAWADDVYVQKYARAMTADVPNNVVAWSSTDVTEWGSASNLVVDNTTKGFGFDVNLYGTSTGITASKSFATTLASDESKVKYEFSWYFGSSLSHKDNYAYVRFGNFIIRWFNNGYSTSISTNGGTSFSTFSAGCTTNTTWTKEVVVIIDLSKSTIEKFTFGGADFTSSVTGTIGGTLTDVGFGFVRGGRGGNWPVPCCLKSFKVSECEQEVAKADYTINYTYNSLTIKSVEGNTAVGTTVYAESPITISDVKYYAKDGEVTSMSIVDGENILNVDLREAETWSYTVRAVNSTAGVLDDNLASGSVTEGESAPIFFFPRFILKGTTLYCSKSGATYYSDVITPDADDYIYDVTYNETPVNNVAFYTEGEDVEGVSQGTNGDRASMGKMGHTGGSETYKEVTTLVPGKYVLYMRFQNANNDARTYNFKVGESVIHTGSAAKGTNNDSYSSEFTVSTSSTLSFASEGSDKGGVDYFYLVKTAEPITVTSAGWATFSSAYPLDFTDANRPEGLTVFRVSGKDGDYITMEPITTTVAANTGLVLKGAAGNYNIPVVASGTTYNNSSDPVNYLFPMVSGGTINKADEGTNYILGLQSGNVVFAPIVDNSATVSAGRAGLWLPGSFSAKALRIVDGETTEVIAPVIVETEEPEVLFNMAGQIVGKDFKGIVINQKGEKKLQK